MLIDSDFKDYYDVIKSYGIDKTVVYCRKTSEVILKDSLVSNYQREEEVLIGFCGKIYPLKILRRIDKPDIYFYTQAGYNKALKKKQDRYRYVSHRELEFWTKPWPQLQELFQSLRTPIFAVTDRPDNKRGCIITLNPKLKDYQFQHVIDPASAFQSIYMYISGVLGTPLNPTVTIDDKHKAIAHGHDGKYSFKKTPGGGQWR